MKIPLFPTTRPQESFNLIRTLCQKRGIDIPDSAFTTLESRMPLLLTPGAAEALVVKIYRQVKTSNLTALEGLAGCLADYQNPVPWDTLQFQIRIAVAEASDSSSDLASFQLPAEMLDPG